MARLSCLVVLILFALPVPLAPQVIQGGTHVVLVNVVAKDKRGKPVDDLRREDFTLLDNGQEQKISLFALEKTNDTATATQSSPARLTFTNRPGAGTPGVTVFLFDELNTSLTDQELAKKDFLRYLQGVPESSRVAVFVLGDSLTLLHDFSQDMASLLAAVAKHPNRMNPQVQASTMSPASSNSLTGDSSTNAKWDAFMKASSQAYGDYAETVRATGTAAALETIARHLQGVPGRKTLVWISGGFAIQLGLHNDVDSIPQSNPNTRRADGARGRGRQGGGGTRSGKESSASNASASNTAPGELPGMGLSFSDDVARAIRALNGADVAVYPVDARGVTVAALYQADRGSIGKKGRQPRAVAGTDFNYETLETLAEQTGGLAFHQINDLNSAIQQAVSDTRVSYSLAFSPSAGTLDGLYHRLEVTVKRPGVSLRYRPGYVAARDRAAAPTLADAIANPVELAGIGFTVQLEPVEGGYKASVTIDPRSITLEPKDGKWTGSLQFLVVVGKTEQLTTIPLNFTEAVFNQIQSQGLILGARVKTPLGTTGFSMGFRDIPSGMVGTLHVPL